MMNNSIRLLPVILGLLAAGCSGEEIDIKGILDSRPSHTVGIWIVGGKPYRITDEVKLANGNGPLGIGSCVELETRNGVVFEIGREDPLECGQ